MLGRMKRSGRLFVWWLALAVAAMIASELVRMAVAGLSVASAAEARVGSMLYAARFVGEAIVFGIVGVVCAVLVRKEAAAGLLALCVGASCTLVAIWSGGAWYYLTPHPSEVDSFFFHAPAHAPVFFAISGCLGWKVYRGSQEAP